MAADSRTTDNGGTNELAIDVRNLTFSYDTSDKPTLRNLSLQLPKGSRCLLIGSNGAGKSTLLSILGGKRLCVQNEDVKILGKHPYYDTSLNLVRSYLDIDWGMRTVSYTGYGLPLQADIAVKDMMKKLQDSYPTRRDELIELMAIDPNWRMHQLSEGQRRRVQILIGLVRPFDILLLDEITSSLDLVVRQDLLDWLHTESIKRSSTIIYATHIFDGMEEWPTHLHYMKHDGTTGWQGTFEELKLYRYLHVKVGDPTPIFRIALNWLKTEREEMKKGCKKVTEIERRHHECEVRPYISGGGYAPGRIANYERGCSFSNSSSTMAPRTCGDDQAS